MTSLILRVLQIGGPYGEVVYVQVVCVLLGMMECVNEENVEEQDKEQKANEPDFSAESFAIRRNSTHEISSMLSSLYVTSDRDVSDDGDDETRSVVNVLSQTEMVQMKVDVGNVKEQIQVLETKLTDAINSSLNRETSLRQIIDISLSKLEEKYNQDLEREVMNCLLRRDEKWERKLRKLSSVVPLLVHRCFRVEVQLPTSMMSLLLMYLRLVHIT